MGRAGHRERARGRTRSSGRPRLRSFDGSRSSGGRASGEASGARSIGGRRGDEGDGSQSRAKAVAASIAGGAGVFSALFPKNVRVVSDGGGGGVSGAAKPSWCGAVVVWRGRTGVGTVQLTRRREASFGWLQDTMRCREGPYSKNCSKTHTHTHTPPASGTPKHALEPKKPSKIYGLWLKRKCESS